HPNATGATAGIPGTWTPAGAQAAADSAEASEWGVVATPATPWTTGQYVQGTTAGAAGRMTWTGSAWVGGAAPLAEGEGEAFDPNDYTVAEVQEWAAPPTDEELAAALRLEEAGKNRSTAITALGGGGG